jgi:hypothetical protein
METLCAIAAALTSVGLCSLYLWLKELKEKRELEKHNKESNK